MPRLVTLFHRRQMLQRRVREALQEIELIDKHLYPQIERLVAVADGLSKDFQIEGMGDTDELEDVLQEEPHRPFSWLGRQALVGPPNPNSEKRHFNFAFRTAFGSRHSAGFDTDERPSTLSDTIAAAVTEILKGQEGPMKTGDLYRKLMAYGVVVPGKNPTSNLSAHLSHRKEFVNKNGGWLLASPEFPFKTDLTDGVPDDPDDLRRFLAKEGLPQDE